VNSKIEQLINFVWTSDHDGAWGHFQLSRFLRIMSMVARDIRSGMLTLRAMSLVYTTLLSMVPLLAVSFSVLKGFGVHNQLEPALINFLAPLGEKAADITHNIVGFVENMKIGVLGALGLGMLMYTVVSLIQKIESAFNFTWRIRSTRNLAQRFSNYLSVVMVGPVLIFSAVGITASLRSNTIVSRIEALPYMGDVIQLVGSFVPYLLIIAAFTFVYLLVPNTRVKPKSALYGAVVAGVLWRWSGMLFAGFAGGSTSYTAIYSGFAILLLFMIWLYLGWMILLIGASIAYYHQHPEDQRLAGDTPHLSAVMRENLCLQLMQIIADEHYHSRGFETSLSSMSARLRVPHSMTARMLNTLEQCGLIVAAEGREARFLPARAIDQISLLEIIQCARLAEDSNMTLQLRSSDEIDQLRSDIDRSVELVLAQKNLTDLITRPDL
jgi:membrane protein